MNTTKNVRHIVNGCIEKHGLMVFGTWTDKPSLCKDPNKRYLTWCVSHGDNSLLDMVQRRLDEQGVKGANARYSDSGYLKVTSYL